MNPEAYFQRVIRFLETKGWNTSQTQVNEDIYIVTGTRESETYYDRMLTLVAVDGETTFGERHIEYLVDAAGEHDVDQQQATCRGGLDDGARELVAEYGIDFIEPETIDDAFIDEFQIEEEVGIFEQARANHEGGGLIGNQHFATSVQYLFALYTVVAFSSATAVLLLGSVSSEGQSLTEFLLSGSLLLVGPILAVIGAIGLTVRETGEYVSVTGVFLGTVVGYVMLLLLMGASGAALGEIGSVGLFSPWQRLSVLFALAVPIASLGVVTAVIQERLRPGAAPLNQS